VPAWLLWAIVAVALAIGEIFTPGLFFLGPIAVAAVAAMIAAALGAGWVIDLVVFVAGAAASLAVLRPIARSHLRMPAALRTGTAALVGARAVVVERVDVVGGRVRIGGEVWSARAFDESQVIEPGTQVQVAEIEGATALVYI
jgi:membrane protein implicated in regulation of membrane protease activity